MYGISDATLSLGELTVAAATATEARVEAILEGASNGDAVEVVATYTLVDTLANLETVTGEDGLLEGATSYTISDASLTAASVESTVAGLAAARAAAVTVVREGEVVAGATNGATITINTGAYTLADTLANLAAAPAATFSGATSYSLTDAEAALGTLQEAAFEIAQGASNASSYTFAAAGAEETLTASATPDVITLTAGNDFVTGPLGTIAATDVVLDTSTSDSDVANLTSNNTAAAIRLQNIETINVTGNFVTTGIDVANITGNDVINLNTVLLGGTATVTNATSVSSPSIVSGANVTAGLDITAAATGTVDFVNVNSGAALAVSLTGGTGVDRFALTGVADTAVVDLEGGTTDIYSVTLTDGEFSLGGDANLTLAIVANGETVQVRLLDDLVGTGATNSITISGTADVTLVTDTVADVAGGISIVNSGTGILEVDIETNLVGDEVADAHDLLEVVADRVVLTGANAEAASFINLNENTTLVLNSNYIVEANDQLTVNVGNDEGVYTEGEGTLQVILEETQLGGITTGAGVGTLILSASADEAADTADSARITLTQDLTLNADTLNVVFTGSDALRIGSTAGTHTVTFTAVSMTGALDVEGHAVPGQFFGGSGNDAISTSLDTGGAVMVLRGAAGNDTLVVGAATSEGTFSFFGEAGNDTLTGTNADDAMVLDGGAGNDSITGGIGGDTISGGDGNDTINGGAGSDRITTGDGNDVVTIAVGEDGDGAERITDLQVGVDRLILTGAPGGAVDLTDLATPSEAGLYNISNFDFILTGVSATDLSDTIQLGATGAAFTLAATGDNVGGNFDDVLATATEEGGAISIRAGLGADSITLDDDDAQTLIIRGGDSTVDEYDEITGFVTFQDILDLDSAIIASAEENVEGTTAFGDFTDHSIDDGAEDGGGIITFQTGTTAITLNAFNFSTAIEYLEANIADQDTVLFQFAGDTWVFQGDTEGDTLVRLVGVASADEVRLIGSTDGESAEGIDVILI